MSNTKTFRLALAQAVIIAISGERGTVTGQATYTNSNDQYRIRYCDGTGCMREVWIDDDALVTSEITPADAAAAIDTDVAAAPTAAAPTAASTAELDVNGMPWDARIHSSSKAKNANGTWRYVKNVDKALAAKIEAAIKVTAAPVATTTAALPPPPAAATAPALPPPPAAVNLPYTNLVAFLAEHTNSPTNPTGRLTAEWIKAALASLGVADGELQNLAHAPADKIAAIESAIKQALGIA